MKKIITLLALVTMLTGSFATTTAFAANDSALYISGAKFISAFHGQDEYNNEILIAMYEKDGELIAYINDGISHVYAGCTEKDTTMKQIGAVEQYTVGGTFVFNFFESNGIPAIVMDDGTVYAGEYLSEYVVTEVMKLD